MDQMSFDDIFKEGVFFLYSKDLMFMIELLMIILILLISYLSCGKVKG